MSGKRAKAVRQTARSESRALTAQASTTLPLGYGFGNWASNGHQGANSGPERGYVYFPQLDTRKEITPQTRTEIMRRSRFLYANVGLAKRLVNGLARMVAGTGLTPQATTRDKKWNAFAEKAFARDVESPFVFDVGGRYDFYKSQQAMLRNAFRDCDSSAVMTESAAGAGRLGFYEGHQVGNALSMPSGQDQLQWSDGVRLGPTNNAIAYRYLGDNGNFTDVAAQNVIFFCDYERAGQSRGLSILSHAVNNLIDAGEIISYIKHGVKTRNRHGYVIESQAGTPVTPSFQGGGSVAGPTRTVTTADGSTIRVEDVQGGGSIPQLDPGRTLKLIGDQSPHPNQLSLIDYLIRDIAWGAGLSPEVIWNIAAMGGANTRFVLADAQGWIEEKQQELVRLYCSRVWVYFISKAIKAKRLPPCEDPEWWSHAWIPPARLTVDFGRDGKLHIEQLKMGMITFKRFFGMQGLEAHEQINTWLDEVADFKAGLNADNAAARTGENRNLTWDDIGQFRNATGFRPSEAADPGPIEDSFNTDEPASAAALAALAKDPVKARALLEKMIAQTDDRAAA